MFNAPVLASVIVRSTAFVEPEILRPRISRGRSLLAETPLPPVLSIRGWLPAARRMVGFGPPFTLTGTVRATPSPKQALAVFKHNTGVLAGGCAIACEDIDDIVGCRNALCCRQRVERLIRAARTACRCIIPDIPDPRGGHIDSNPSGAGERAASNCAIVGEHIIEIIGAGKTEWGSVEETAVEINVDNATLFGCHIKRGRKIELNRAEYKCVAKKLAVVIKQAARNGYCWAATRGDTDLQQGIADCLIGIVASQRRDIPASQQSASCLGQSYRHRPRRLLGRGRCSG